MAFILNYAGWRISDFPPDAAEVLICDTDIGAVWIVTPQTVTVPAAEGPPVPARSTFTAPAYPSFPATGGHRLPPPPSPLPLPFSRHLRFVDLEFAEGAVSFALDHRRAALPSEQSREVYNPVRDLLDEELPAGVRLVGEEHPDGSVTGEVRGLERLAEVFERALFRQFVRQSCAARDWLDAEKLAAERPGGGGRRDPDGLIDIPEFGLGKRAEAFHRLFAHRDREERVSILPGRALVVPLPALDGGHRWYAWETMEDDHATYLFRPADPDARDRMLAWTQMPGAKRRDLLDDKNLQAELGYARRVMHHDGGEQQLGRWWAHLCRVLASS